MEKSPWENGWKKKISNLHFSSGNQFLIFIYLFWFKMPILSIIPVFYCTMHYALSFLVPMLLYCTIFPPVCQRERERERERVRSQGGGQSQSWRIYLSVFQREASLELFCKTFMEKVIYKYPLDTLLVLAKMSFHGYAIEFYVMHNSNH